MMLDTPSLSHQPATPPGSPPTPSSPPSGMSPSAASSVSSGMAACGEGAVSAELAQQANEVCQLVAKANRAPRGLHADELRRLLSDIHSLHVLAQQLSPSSPSATSTSSTSTSGSSPSSSPPVGRPSCGTAALGPSCGIAKKKPTHHSAVLSRPLCSSAPTTATSTARSPPSPLLSSPSSFTSTPATHIRGCTPIRPRAVSAVESTPSPALIPSANTAIATTTAAATSTTTTTTPSSASVESGPRACANCGTSNTVQWRCGADGKPSLCNACGLRYRYNLKKKALYEDIASVRAMTQRSPPFLHSPPPAPSSPSSVSSSSSPFFNIKASRSPSFVGAASPHVTTAAGCPPRPAPHTTITNNAASTTTHAGTTSSSEGEARRSNIYNLLN